MVRAETLLTRLIQFVGTQDGQLPYKLEAFAQGWLDPETTARRIAIVYEEQLRQGDDSKNLELWHALTTLSIHCGRARANAARLVVLLDSLSDQGTITHATEASTQGTRAENYFFWRDLPGFSWAFRMHGFDPCLYHHQPLSTKQSYFDATTFAATYLQQGKPSRQKSLTLFAEVGIMIALEYRPGEPADLHLPAAATWIEIAAKRIKKLCMENYKRDDDAPGLPEAMYGQALWKGGRGFSLPRWEFWKQRFDSLTQSDEMSGELSGLA